MQGHVTAGHSAAMRGRQSRQSRLRCCGAPSEALGYLDTPTWNSEFQSSSLRSDLRAFHSNWIDGGNQRSTTGFLLVVEIKKMSLTIKLLLVRVPRSNALFFIFLSPYFISPENGIIIKSLGSELRGEHAKRRGTQSHQ